VTRSLGIEELNKIIDAVGEGYSANVNSSSLYNDLLDAQARLATLTAADSDKEANEKNKLFNAVTKNGMELRETLLRHSAWAAGCLFTKNSEAQAFLDTLKRIVKVAESSAEKFRHGAVIRLHRPPKEWFAGEVLCEVYERNFRRPAKVSRPDSSKEGKKSPTGPFIRFAVAVMCEMGIPISPETVARAFKDARNNRARRKRRPATLPDAPD
jgi:hypothetical protein